MNFEKLNELKQSAMLNMTAKLNTHSLKKEIVVCTNTACHSNGGQSVLNTFREEIKKHKLGTQVKVNQVGCMGLCAKGPIVIVYPEKTFYCKVTKELASKIITQHIIGGKVVEELLFDKNLSQDEMDKIDFYKKQTFVARKNIGLIDPLNIMDYIAFDGYLALYKVLKTYTENDVIALIKTSGLLGRGGAGYPAYKKWQQVKNAISDEKYIICNCGDMDRSIIDADPHLIVEAVAIAGYAVRATKGIIYIRAEYEMAADCVKKAILDAKKLGLLGKNIFETDFCFDIEVRLGAGLFVCGEETALIKTLEGKRGEPDIKPPYPSECGYLEKPTLVNNVETLACVPSIVLNGSEWFKKLGIVGSGTKVFALSGKVKHAGLIEVKMGTPLKEVVYNIGGGLIGDKRLKAVMIGGSVGGCIPADMLNIPLNYSDIENAGALVGGSGIIVLDEDTCMVDLARFFVKFSMEESCGKCTACRLGTVKLYEILTKICDGKGQLSDIQELEETCEYLKNSSLCGLGKFAPNPVLSTLKYFKDEYLEHIKGKCRANVCVKLKHYEIMPNVCVGCSACSRVCPVKAISGEIRKPFKIDQSKCVKCGKCFETCRFGAIKRGEK